MAVEDECETRVDFCTLGMFIIDEIHYRSSTPPVFNILGGAGSYSALGARLLSPSLLSKSVGWIVDVGKDFPPELRKVITSWDTYCLLRETPERLTTRGWNGYEEYEKRAFKYTTPKLRLDHNSLDETLLSSKSFHLISSPNRCSEQVNGILERRVNVTLQTPLFIWEPVPDLCIPEELDNCLQTLKLVDVVSPNHSELCGFFGKQGDLSTGEVNKPIIEECCKQWLASGIGSNNQGVIVVRAGAAGCLICTRETQRWMPAFHSSSLKVVDPTGGGNAFLGGLAICMARGQRSNQLGLEEEAAAWGTVAASFAIEQVGIPVLKHRDGKETWNDEDVLQRLAEYKQRLLV